MSKTSIRVGTISSARHAEGARKGLGTLMWVFFLKLKWQYFPLLLSDYGREILVRKYDALATDRAYENHPSGLLGPFGRWVDRMVLSFPLHEGLRQRLRIVVDDLKTQISEQVQAGKSKVRVLSAPCGLTRDLICCTKELQQEDGQILEKIELHALDLDATGEVLIAASQRAAAANVPVRFYQDDLFNPRGFSATLQRGVRFHIVNCIGLTAWLDLQDVERLARFFHDEVLEPGGTLIVDNWSWHQHSALGKDLEIHTRYHDPMAFVETLKRSGFRFIDSKRTTNGVATVYMAKA